MLGNPLPSLQLKEIPLSPFTPHDGRSTPCPPSAASISLWPCLVSKAKESGAYIYSQDTSWEAYPARRSFVRFRKRSSAKRRRSFERRESSARHPPSQLVQNVLCCQYDVCCRRRQGLIPDRLAAVFYCWLLGWIADVYDSFSDPGAEHSFKRWTLACVIIAAAAILVVVLAVAMMVAVLQLFFEVLLSALYFAAILVGLVVIVVACISIVNFD